MKVIKKTGLVPVKDVTTGEIFGVMPETARTQILAGKFALIMDIPEEHETEEVDGPEVDKDGFYVQPKEGDRRGSAGKASKPQGDNEENEIKDIPENWRDMQHLQRIKLAKDLYPDYTPTTENGKWTADHADQKIQEMVDFRTQGSLV